MELTPIFITYLKQKLTKNLKFSLLCLAGVLAASCQTQSDPAIRGELSFPDGEVLKLELAVTDQEQTRGLSHRTKEDFPKDRGMLFVYSNNDFRQFWMPETFFDLAIAFLNENFVVMAVENPVAHHTTRIEPIPRTDRYWSRHVLEVRSDSPFAKLLRPGVQLSPKGEEFIDYLKSKSFLGPETPISN